MRSSRLNQEKETPPRVEGSRQREDGFAGYGRRSLEGYSESGAELGHESKLLQNAQMDEWMKANQLVVRRLSYSGVLLGRLPIPSGLWRGSQSVKAPAIRALMKHFEAVEVLRSAYRVISPLSRRQKVFGIHYCPSP